MRCARGGPALAAECIAPDSQHPIPTTFHEDGINLAHINLALIIPPPEFRVHDLMTDASGVGCRLARTVSLLARSVPGRWSATTLQVRQRFHF